MEQRSFFGLEEQLALLSEAGDPLEALDATVDFEDFRDVLLEGLGYGDGSNVWPAPGASADWVMV